MPKKPPLPWPPHWYQGPHDIRCIIPHCGFITDANKLAEQWTQLHSHCRQHANEVEHSLLEIMLRQSKCALCTYPPFYGHKYWAVRALCDHERYAHDSMDMFSIDSFVVLAREGRVLFSGGTGGGGGHLAPEASCQRLAFDRMMNKVWALPDAELGLLFQKSGCSEGQYTAGNLARILTYDPAAQLHESDPFWAPVQADRFLEFCRPHGDDPADSNWRRVWRDLRERYADGRI